MLQGQTAPCTMSTSASVSCTAAGLQGLSAMSSCFQATMTCAGARGIILNYGYKNPTGTPKGTIVLLPGAGGQNANPEMESTFANDYTGTTSGSTFSYQVVQLQWSQADWEDVNQGGTTGTTATYYTPNIEVAAARPATFLNYVYNNFYLPIKGIQNNSHAGMCAQGFSGGSGAVAYALAFYSAGSYLDKADLLSGPVFSDISLGCAPPPPQPVSICSGNPTPAFCELGTPGGNYQPPWNDDPNYTEHPLNSVKMWSDIQGCTCGSSNGNNQATCNASWKGMSIVNGNSNPPVFSYPNTVVTGFVCAPGVNGIQNNSAAQGWVFFSNGVTANQLSFYPVQNCPGPEEIYHDQNTFVPALNEDGLDAIENDMASGMNPNGFCQSYHP